ncbi:hypothetical protein BBAD15_g2399 [Beauveria bassiana D1-5]|uniref:Uncharacterized protein n=1 Tax=Beauveria bassiana D1-5 TaxID=1245745 RepID=A0A0A2VZQ0_BEABA|nr:hypothetical protein BBAD15_g2399 [Beauveria bassiana D1-5]
MSLSRAFTTSRRKLGLDIDSAPSFMKRSNTTTKTPPSRPKISAPVELIHTTNILTYNAPDLPRPYRSNSASSKTPDSDTETFMTTDSTPPTSPDVSPHERDCASPTPEPNHLSCYFQTAGRTSLDPAAPIIPKRSPSHTKKASYEALARKRSSRQSRDSDMSASSRPGLTFSPLPATPPANVSKESHPFGQELAQVSELVEEYGVGNKLKPIDEEEEMYLSSRCLSKFSANDYLGIVHGLSSSFFPEHTAAPAPLWI